MNILTSESAQHGHRLTSNGGLVAWDRIVERISGHQPNMAVRPPERLNRGFPFNHGGYDLTILSDRLLADDYLVSIRDRSVDH